MDAASLVGPIRSPVVLTPGTLTLDVCAGGNLYYVIELRIADIPRDPPGTRHSSESLINALEDRVFRRVCYVNNVHLCGPAPRMSFGPVDPALAFVAPRFGTAPFWRRVQLFGALRTCSFEWPAGLVHSASTPIEDTPSASDRSSHEHGPSASTDLAGSLSGGSPKANSARSCAFVAAFAGPGPPGTLRVHVVIGAATLESATPLDFDSDLFEIEEGVQDSPSAFTRMMEAAVFARLCSMLGLQARGPAPRGRFIPPIGCRVFRRAVAARGAGCHYRVWLPVGLARRSPPAPSTSSSSSSSSSSSLPPPTGSLTSGPCSAHDPRA